MSNELIHRLELNVAPFERRDPANMKLRLDLAKMHEDGTFKGVLILVKDAENFRQEASVLGRDIRSMDGNPTEESAKAAQEEILIYEKAFLGPTAVGTFSLEDLEKLSRLRNVEQIQTPKDYQELDDPPPEDIQ